MGTSTVSKPYHFQCRAAFVAPTLLLPSHRHRTTFTTNLPIYHAVCHRLRIQVPLSRTATKATTTITNSLFPISFPLSLNFKQNNAHNDGNCGHEQWKHKVATIAVAVTAIIFTLTQSPTATDAYGLESGRMAKCRGDAPCVSTTSVSNPSKFGPPWSYQPQTGSATEAWASLKETLSNLETDKGVIVESIDGPSEYYLRAEFHWSFLTWKGTDDVEFRLIEKDSLVSYRSASRDAIYVYPIQAPVNTDQNKKRLEMIRSSLGWEEFAGNELYVGSGSGGGVAPE